MEISLCLWKQEPSAPVCCDTDYVTALFAATVCQLVRQFGAAKWRILKANTGVPGAYFPSTWYHCWPSALGASDALLADMVAALRLRVDEDAQDKSSMSLSTIASGASADSLLVVFCSDVPAFSNRILPDSCQTMIVNTSTCCPCHVDTSAIFQQVTAAGPFGNVVDGASILCFAHRVGWISNGWLTPSSANEGEALAKYVDGTLPNEDASSSPRSYEASPVRVKQLLATSVNPRRLGGGTNGKRAIDAVLGLAQPVKIAPSAKPRRGSKALVASSPSAKLVQAPTPIEHKRVGFESPSASAVRLVHRASRHVQGSVPFDLTSRLSKFLVDETPVKDRCRQLVSHSPIQSLLLEHSGEGAAQDAPDVEELTHELLTRLLMLPSGALGSKVATLLHCKPHGQLYPFVHPTESLACDAAMHAVLASDPSVSAWWLQFVCSAKGGLTPNRDTLSASHIQTLSSDASGIETLKRIYDGVRSLRADMDHTITSACSPPRVARKTGFLLHSADVCASTKFPGHVPMIPPRPFSRLCALAAALQLPPRIQRVLDRLVYAFFALADPDRLIKGMDVSACQEALSANQHYASHEPAVPSWMLLPVLDVRRFVSHEIPAAISLLSSFEYDIARLSPGFQLPVPDTAGASPCRVTDHQRRHDVTPNRAFCSPSRRAVQAVSNAWLAPDPVHENRSSLETIKLLLQHREEGELHWPQMRNWWAEFSDSDFGDVHHRTTPILGPEAACSLVLRVICDVILADLQDSDFCWDTPTSVGGILPVAHQVKNTFLRRVTNKRRRGPWASMLSDADAAPPPISTTIRARHRTLQFISLFFMEAHTNTTSRAPSSQPRRLGVAARTRATSLVADLCYLLAAPGAGVSQSGLGFMAQHCELGHVARWLKIITEPTFASLFPVDVLNLYIERGLTPPISLEDVCSQSSIEAAPLADQTHSGRKRGREIANMNDASPLNLPLRGGDRMGGDRHKEAHFSSPPRQRRRPGASEVAAPINQGPPSFATEVSAVEQTVASALPLLLPVDRVAGGELLDAPKRFGWGLARVIAADKTPPSFGAPPTVDSEDPAPVKMCGLASEALADPLAVAQSPLKKNRSGDRPPRKVDGPKHSSKYGRPQPSVSLNSDKWIKKLGKQHTVFLRRALGSLNPTIKPQATGAP